MVLEIVQEYVGEEGKDEVEKKAAAVEGEKDVTISADKKVDKDLVDEKTSDDNESWLVRVGDDSEPIELTNKDTLPDDHLNPIGTCRVALGHRRGLAGRSRQYLMT